MDFLICLIKLLNVTFSLILISLTLLIPTPNLVNKPLPPPLTFHYNSILIIYVFFHFSLFSHSHFPSLVHILLVDPIDWGCWGVYSVFLIHPPHSLVSYSGLCTFFPIPICLFYAIFCLCCQLSNYFFFLGGGGIPLICHIFH